MNSRSDRISLSLHYPLEARSVLLRVWSWLIIGCGLTFLIVWTDIEVPLVGYNLHLFEMGIEAKLLLLTVVAVVAARIIYAWLYRATFRVELVRDQLEITKGVVLKRQGSFPLVRISDFYLGQDLSHFFLGLHYLEILTATPRSGGFSRIEGLSRMSAEGLSATIHQLIAETRAGALSEDGLAPLTPIVKARVSRPAKPVRDEVEDSSRVRVGRDRLPSWYVHRRHRESTERAH